MGRHSLGVASFVPLVYMILFAAFLWWWTNVLDVSKMTGSPKPFIAGMVVIGIMHVSVMVLMIGLIIYYIRLVVGDPDLGPDEKTLWIVGILFLNPVAFPVAYFIHVQSRGKSIAGNAQASAF